jgi:hypothetical protein
MDAVQKVKDLIQKALHEGTPEKERDEAALAAIRIVDKYNLIGNRRVDVAATILNKITSPDFVEGIADRAERVASGFERVVGSAKKVAGQLARDRPAGRRSNRGSRRTYGGR